MAGGNRGLGIQISASTSNTTSCRIRCIRLLHQRSTKMHRALFVSEILVEIFVSLNQLPSSTIGWTQSSLTRKSLASLARTCKTFHEPAMDLLWAYMPGLRPLFGCVTRLHAMIYDPKSKVSAEFCQKQAHRSVSVLFVCRFAN